ncbi:TPA: stage 0 sporulation protein [Candidatus Falkowbacteria bacterium]|nr:stage 0 sporulation protein [Candidatus Falkowbacteria bacterium]
MNIYEVQIKPWDGLLVVETDDDLPLGSYICLETELGQDLAKVKSKNTQTKAAVDKTAGQVAKFIAPASRENIEHALDLKKKEKKALSDCKAGIKKHKLPMKLVDAHFSFDDKRLTYAFISNGRVDFRYLLRDLVKMYKLNIRLQQIGIRDEIKINGDLGCCGEVLCCQDFLRDLGNVSSDLADLQQIAHRGSERLSGVCGRLKCCLNYEKECYHDCAKCLPVVGTRVRTDSGRGVVIGWHTLKKSVDVRLDDGATVIEVPIKSNPKK